MSAATNATWRPWNRATPCRRCGGWLTYSGGGKRCAGGLALDNPHAVYCSNESDERYSTPTRSGRLHRWIYATPTAWAPDPAGEGSSSSGRWSRWGPGVPPTWRLVADYVYFWDEDRERAQTPEFGVCRYEATDPDERARLLAHGEDVKTFRPWCQRSGTQRRWGMGGTPRIPFMLPRWRRAVAAGGLRLFACEGEKDVLAGYEHFGDVAAFTTAPGGVNGWLAMLRDDGGAEHFRGIDALDVVLHRDENHASETLREAIDQYLVRPGVVSAARFWQAHSSIAAPGADLHDHASAGLGLEDLEPA